MREPSVLVICVNYNSDDDTAAYVAEILKQQDAERFHVVVVNNRAETSTESKLHHILPADKRVFLYETGSNLGYFGGAAYGLHMYLENHPLPEWVIVSNTDISFLHDDFFRKLIAFGRHHQHALVAPAIFTPSGKNQNIFMKIRPRAAKMRFYKWIFKFYTILMVYELLSKAKERLKFIAKRLSGYEPAVPQQRLTKIYAPHGSFIAFRRIYFESGGNLNHGTFLFGEEIFIAETARKLGLTIAYDPRLKIQHNEHKTTGYLRSRKIGKYVGDAAAYCYNTFFNEKTRF